MLVLINVASGTLSAAAERDRLRDAFHAAGMSPRIVEIKSASQIRPIIEKDAPDIVVGAGGDGTLSAVAACLAGTGRAFGVIPGGTLNHFAKDLGIPAEFEAAVAVLKAGGTRLVDIAEVNGMTFLNNSSVGIYPQVVRAREKIRGQGFRKLTAFAAAIVKVMLRWPLVRVNLEFEGRTIRRRTPFVFVGNNRYEMEGLKMGSRQHLDAGELCLCVARSLTRLELIRMAIRGLTGGLHDSGDLDVLSGAEAVVHTRRRVDVSLDGEVVRMRSPLRYRIRPRALRVIVP